MKEKFLKAKQLIREKKYKEFLVKTVMFFPHHIFLKCYRLVGRPLLLRRMRNDSRFYVGDTWLNNDGNDMLKNYIISQPVRKYEIDTIKLGDINIQLQDKKSSLCDSPIYTYIRGDEESYRAFSRKCFEYWHPDEDIHALIDRDVARYNDTIRRITNDGYDIRKGAIIVDDHNVLLDGAHRSCVLMSLFGPEYEISVLKIYYMRWL